MTLLSMASSVRERHDSCLRRGWHGGLAAGRKAAGTSAALSCVALAVSACAGDDADMTLRLPSANDEFGDIALATRPTACKPTQAVRIIAGKPQPRELELNQGACLIWRNESSETWRCVAQPRRRQ